MLTSHNGLTTSPNGLSTSHNGPTTAYNGLSTSQHGLTTAQNGLLTSHNGRSTSHSDLSTSHHGLTTAHNGPVTLQDTCRQHIMSCLNIRQLWRSIVSNNITGGLKLVTRRQHHPLFWCGSIHIDVWFAWKIPNLSTWFLCTEEIYIS